MELTVYANNNDTFFVLFTFLLLGQTKKLNNFSELLLLLFILKTHVLFRENKQNDKLKGTLKWQ